MKRIFNWFYPQRWKETDSDSAGAKSRIRIKMKGSDSPAPTRLLELPEVVWGSGTLMWRLSDDEEDEGNGEA